jgi:NAD+ kinase
LRKNKGFTSLKIGIIANTRKKLFWKKLPDIIKWASDQKTQIIFSKQITQDSQISLKKFPSVSSKELAKKCDMIFAFGGDGTILNTAQNVADRNTPILGVNIGGLGFLTEVPLRNCEKVFNQILKGKYTIEERTMLKAFVDGDPVPFYALNDIIIDRGKYIRVIEIKIDINNKYLNTYIADGLLISTPTGSTGYSLSSGGPITFPSSEVFIINPISPHSLTNRPVIIPSNSTVTATVSSEYPEITVSADGMDSRYYKTGAHLNIEKAPFSAHLVKSTGSDFFALLRNKLNWGEDFRKKNRWGRDS